MTIHANLIAGSWVEGSEAAPNVNPSNTDDVVGEYTRASGADTALAITATKADLPG